MDLQFEVNRKRKEFGVHANFHDLPCTRIIFEETDDDLDEFNEKCPSGNWEQKQTKTQTFESIPQYSVHAVNKAFALFDFVFWTDKIFGGLLVQN